MSKFAPGKLLIYDLFSPVLVPGTALLPSGLLAISYALALIYLFLGISIVSDIFMR